MTDAEAKKLLELLEEHFQEPVYPMSFFCKTLRQWAQIIREEAIEYHKTLKEEPFSKRALDDSEFIWDLFNRTIPKSNLLWRMFYGKEEPRTEKCPVHKGHWSGCHWEELECGCMSGCNVTGWLGPSVLNDNWYKKR